MFMLKVVNVLGIRLGVVQVETNVGIQNARQLIVLENYLIGVAGRGYRVAEKLPAFNVSPGKYKRSA